MTVRICHKMQSLPLFFLDWGSNNQKRCTVFDSDQICGIENVTSDDFATFAAQNAGEHYQV